MRLYGIPEFSWCRPPIPEHANESQPSTARGTNRQAASFLAPRGLLWPASFSQRQVHRHVGRKSRALVQATFGRWLDQPEVDSASAERPTSFGKDFISGRGAVKAARACEAVADPSSANTDRLHAQLRAEGFGPTERSWGGRRLLRARFDHARQLALCTTAALKASTIDELGESRMGIFGHFHGQPCHIARRPNTSAPCFAPFTTARS